jgi:predicted dehydrogenase
MEAAVSVAVIGTGSLGKQHARLYAELAKTGEARFVGVYDSNHEQARLVAHERKTQAFESMEELMDQADAFSVVTPTVTHFEIASLLLKAGKHVLVEKPITQTSAQAQELIELAQQQGLALQVGHIERFNPTYQYLRSYADEPRFIEAHRLSPYPARSSDIGVTLDLMIHDLDVILSFVRSPLKSIDAVGIQVLSGSEDIANARLKFENGCVANLTASRVSPERMRKIRVFSAGDAPCYVSLDFMAQEGFIYRIAKDDEPSSSLFKKLLRGASTTIVSEFAGKKITREPAPLEKDEPLKLELRSFIECVREKKTPIVSGEAGKLALDVALEITQQIQSRSES